MKAMLVAALVAGAAALTPGAAAAGCHAGSTNEALETFMPALHSALASDGLPAPILTGTQGNMIFLTVPLSGNVLRGGVGFRIIQQDNVVDEVDAGVMAPVSAKDQEMFTTVAAALAAPMAGTAERQIRDDMAKGLADHPGMGSYQLRWGRLVASTTRFEKGVGVLLRDVDCD